MCAIYARATRSRFGISAETYLTQGERLKLVQGDLWVHFKKEPNRSRLMPILGSKRLGTGTVRNWNTVRRLAEMLQ